MTWGEAILEMCMYIYMCVYIFKCDSDVNSNSNRYFLYFIFQVYNIYVCVRVAVLTPACVLSSESWISG
jgi:hypothetical protein